MARWLALFLALALSALFLPRWDLWVRDQPFAAYRLAAEGFWRPTACRAAARERGAVAFRCRRRTLYERLLGTSARTLPDDSGEVP